MGSELTRVNSWDVEDLRGPWSGPSRLPEADWPESFSRNETDMWLANIPDQAVRTATRVPVDGRLWRTDR